MNVIFVPSSILNGNNSQNATLEPPLRWEQCVIHLKLVIFARKGIVVDFLTDPQNTVTGPAEPICEIEVEEAQQQLNQKEID